MYSQIAANKRKTLYLIAGFVIFIWLVGFALAEYTGRPGFVVGLTVFAVVYASISYFASAWIAVKLSHAKPIAKRDAPELYRIVENLSIAAGLPMPKVYIMNDPAPNAFATGRDPKNAIVAVTTGLLEVMDQNELEGVVAHELSHIGNYDIRVMAVVAALATIISFITDFFLRFTFWGGGDDEESSASGILAILGIVLAIVAPIVATLIQLAVSRRREYLADASGSLLTRYPQGLASALKKIGAYSKPMKHAHTATAHMFIANPLKKSAGRSLAGLFSTHPPVEDRIAKLAQMETGA